MCAIRSGKLCNRRYKIPNISDVPEIFNVAMLDNPDNVVSLKRSKALGEPPLLLGISVWTAVKNALSFVHEPEIPKLSLPATNEAILLSIESGNGSLRKALTSVKA